MSEPSRLLQNLNLEEMPVTRSQGQSSQQRRGIRGRGRGRMNPLGGLSPAASQSGSSRPPASTPDAPHGPPQPPPPMRLAPYISVDHLQLIDRDRSHNDPLREDSYYAIQLNPVSVRIRDPTGGPGRVECTCPAFQSTLSPCAHIHVSHLPIRTSAVADIISGSLPVFTRFFIAGHCPLHRCRRPR